MTVLNSQMAVILSQVQTVTLAQRSRHNNDCKQAKCAQGIQKKKSALQILVKRIATFLSISREEQ